MKTREYLILLALAEADLHGLAIARAVQELSEGQTRLWPVSLYGTLESLEGSRA
jgi:DNA-binding PadR family transcriptional regulator